MTLHCLILNTAQIGILNVFKLLVNPLTTDPGPLAPI